MKFIIVESVSDDIKMKYSFYIEQFPSCCGVQIMHDLYTAEWTYCEKLGRWAETTDIYTMDIDEDMREKIYTWMYEISSLYTNSRGGTKVVVADRVRSESLERDFYNSIPSFYGFMKYYKLNIGPETANYNEDTMDVIAEFECDNVSEDEDCDDIDVENEIRLPNRIELIVE